jgi:hypothetical protein
MLSLLFLSPPALAASDPDPLPSFQDCQPDRAHYGEIPSCTYDETGKVIDKTYDDPMGGGSGMPGEFVGLFVLALLVGGGLTAWRVSTARDIARRAGLDPDDATATALLTQNGLDATYLAASLRQNGHATPPPVQPKSTEDRLHELTRLHAQGLVTQAEYDERRSAILAEI